LKTLTNFKIPFRNPLRKACCSILKPACHCKTCSGTRLWFRNCSANRHDMCI
jgi:hypothetical protein